MAVKIDYNLQKAYDDSYGVVGGYYSENKELIWEFAGHEKFLPQLNISPGQTVLIVGAGFGWIAERMVSNGLGPICAVDTSQWIQSLKSQHASMEIYDFDVSDVGTHDQIRQILGLQNSEKIDWCLTEDFFTEIPDQECLDISSALRLLGNNVIHYITKKPTNDIILNLPQFTMRNWKTEAEWNSMLSPDQIISR